MQQRTSYTLRRFRYCHQKMNLFLMTVILLVTSQTVSAFPIFPEEYYPTTHTPSSHQAATEKINVKTEPYKDSKATSTANISDTTSKNKQILSSSLIPYRATYKAKYSGFSIDITRSLQKSSGNNRSTTNFYHIKSNAEALVSNISESSNMMINEENHILPLNYHYSKKGLGNKKKVNINFDWKKNIGHYKDKKRDTISAIDIGVLDKMTLYTQLRRDLIKTGNTLLRYKVLDRGKVRDFHYKVLGEKVIQTSLGSVNTIKVERLRERKSRKTILWFAKPWNHVLVKLIQQESGSDYEMNIQSLMLNNVSIKAKK